MTRFTMGLGAVLLVTGTLRAATPLDSAPLLSASKTAEAAVEKIALYREISVRAVENAFAAEALARQDLVAALGKGSNGALDKARAAARDSARESGEAVALVERIIVHEGEARSAVASIAAEAELMAQPRTERRERKSLERVRESAEEALQAMEGAGQVLDELKERWLIPALP